MVISILCGLLAASLVFLAWVAKKLLDLEKRLDTLQRVGVLVTGDEHPLTGTAAISRRELIRRIENSATKRAVNE